MLSSSEGHLEASLSHHQRPVMGFCPLEWVDLLFTGSAVVQKITVQPSVSPRNEELMLDLWANRHVPGVAGCFLFHTAPVCRLTDWEDWFATMLQKKSQNLSSGQKQIILLRFNFLN